MSKEKDEFKAIEDKQQFHDNKVRQWAVTLGVNPNDIYHAVLMVYKTDNQLREQSNKNAMNILDQKNIELKGQKFLIDQYRTVRTLNRIRRWQRIVNLFKSKPKNK